MSVDADSRRVLIFFVTAALTWGCAKTEEASTSQCATKDLTPVSSHQGKASVFMPDPVVSSRDATLSPSSFKLDELRTSTTVSNLGGKGVLEGLYVDVRNGTCGEWFGAFDNANNFVYSHQDMRFQEAMAYKFGDEYRAYLDKTGYLLPKVPVRIVAHCMNQDNAYFARTKDVTGQFTGKVCLGDSVVTPGASYGDDAEVTVHELQHATTVETYSPSINLNQMWYDEAGALNEAISDFMGLVYLEPLVSNAALDPRTFSRWALDKFLPGMKSSRGAHKCPTYDTAFQAGCSNYPAFSGDGNTISYVYPDGLGWPYANNYPGSAAAKTIFHRYTSQEEIHNAGILMAGALYDIYEALKATHAGSADQGYLAATQVVLEALRHLPHPSLTVTSPVTFRGFAAQMVSAAALLGFPALDQNAIAQALTSRGLVGGPSVPAAWAAVGDGRPATPGLRIIDNPTVLKTWLLRMGSDPVVITQGIATGLNEQLDPGETVALWLDVKNTSHYTAGGVRITVTSQDPDVTFLDNSYNAGYLSPSQAQIQYGKINGLDIVQALGSIPSGNSYFNTNPFFDKTFTTAIWAQVKSTAAHPKTAVLSVESAASNGETAIVNFTVQIN